MLIFSDFNTCDVDVLGCSEYDGDFNSAVCAYTEHGCLFNLEVDPCEVHNLGDEYPEIRDFFIDRLSWHQDRAPEAIMLQTDAMAFSEVFYKSLCGVTWPE